MYFHTVFDYSVSSSIPLAASRSASENSAANNIEISKKSFPDEYSDFSWLGRTKTGSLRSYGVGDGILIKGLRSVGVYLPSETREIHAVFDETSIYERNFAKAILSNLALSVRALLDGDILLHCASVVVNGGLIAVMAESGTGKSTLLWQLIDRGALFAGDDILKVKAANDEIEAIPSISLHAKMRSEELQAMRFDVGDFEECLPNTREYWFPIPIIKRATCPYPLRALFLLKPALKPKSPNYLTLQYLRQDQAIMTLMANTQGLWAAGSFIDAHSIFLQYLHISQTIPVYMVNYCRQPGIIPSLADLIFETSFQEARLASKEKALR